MTLGMDIRIADLIKRYGQFRALHQVSLQFRGGMLGLLGPNGAGKTTLMRIVTGLMPPTAGEVYIGGIDVVRRPELLRPYLGYLPQSFGFYKGLSGYEMLDYIAIMKNIPPSRRRGKITEVLEQVNLTAAARRRIGGYSGGMKQRLGIAQALLGDPRLLVVDEPTAGLDPEERIRFRNMLSDLARDRTVLLSTHIVADVEASCTALAVLQQGRLAFFGTPDQLRRKARGRVWESEIPAAEWAHVETRCRAVATRPMASGLHVRVLADENPFYRAEPVEPTLEDGYLTVMDGEPGYGDGHG